MRKSKPSRKTLVSDLKPDQRATLFPSLGYFDVKRNRPRAFVHGRVYTEGKVPLGTRVLLNGLKRAMKATPDQYESETFQHRIEGFLTSPGRRRRIVLSVGSQRYRLRRRTRRNGSFFGTLNLPKDLPSRLPMDGVGYTIPMELQRSADATGVIPATLGHVHFVPPQGMSIISDIDDTIKLTDATNKREMLSNTFLKPFEVIEGMAELYKYWRQQGCEFHYVSSSPWQLYKHLAELCSDSGFPTGSMHLRYFRVTEEMIKRFKLLRQHTKVGITKRILRRLPHRKFILVGDSGEKDPEIYCHLAKRFPNQISAILIRDLTARPLAGRRLAKLKYDQSLAPLISFTSTNEIENIVDQVSYSAT